MKKIALFCAAGMSTSLLVAKTQAAAQQDGLDYEIAAHPISEISVFGPEADIILLGPQVMYKLRETRSMIAEKPVEAIDLRDYGMMRGDNVIMHVKEVLGD
ncbi:MAG: PTS sugar transporter subunit IIB [Erysipelotrichaceae bacterium]|nr:PTS sugar transporter subunit IIB [Erysipelotrichaceae bacterium]